MTKTHVFSAVPLSYREFGDPDATPLIMIAGAGGSKDGWGPLITALSDDYRLICPDHLGAPRRSTLTMASAADDVAALLDHLGVPWAHVLGWSFGSAVAQVFALRHPDRLGALLLWSTWARTDGYLRAVFTGLRYPFAHGDVDTAVTVLGTVFSPELLDSPAYQQVLSALLPLVPRTPDQLRTTVEQWDANLQHDQTGALPSVHAPTLVIAGEQDTLAPPRYGREVAELLPRSRFVLFDGPGSSHAVGLERVTEFSALVRGFLAEPGLDIPRMSVVNGGLR